MAKNHMGRRSHLAQDVQFDQNSDGIDREVGDQPTRPTVHHHQATKNPKKEPPMKSSRTTKPHRAL
jgi:hypothetical protein